MSQSYQPTIEFSTFAELLRERALQQSEQSAYTFLVDGEAEELHLTYAELDRQARSIAALLQRHLQPGEQALLLYPPGLEYVAAFFGCLYAGVVAVPAYPPQLNRSLSRLNAIATDAQATVALTTTQTLSHVEHRLAHVTYLQGLKWLATDHLPGNMADQWQKTALTRDSLAFLQYTSGSTTTPKGVMLTHGNLMHNSALIHQCFGHMPKSRGVIWLPPYHDMGLIGGILQPLYGGFPVTLMSPISFLQRPLRWLQAISRCNATTSGGPNFAYDLCVQKITPEQRSTLDLSSWDIAFNGAEPIRPETIEQFTNAFASCGFRHEAFYPCYGLAEATLLVSGGKKANSPNVRIFEVSALEQNQVVETSKETKRNRILTGCGQTLSDQQIVVVNPESLSLCLPEQVGEIWVSGSSVAQGYWSRPEQTEQTFRASLPSSPEHCFLRTGDLGFLHEGELFVTGRLKDLIIIRGRNHYPQDIERTVEQCHPALQPACGAAFSIEVAGEERLVVVQEVKRSSLRTLGVDEVSTAIRQAVTQQHELQVHGVVLLKPSSILKTSSGKIQRHACRSGFLNRSLDIVGNSILVESDTALSQEHLTRDALLAIAPRDRQTCLTTYLQQQVAQVLKIVPSQVNPQQPLSSLGLDSLMVIELRHTIETRLGVVLPMESFFQNTNLIQLTTDLLSQVTAHEHRISLFPVSDHSDTTEFALSYGQRSLWFLHQLAPESSAYNIAIAVRVRTTLNRSALQRAFLTLVERHPVLRTTFTVSQGHPRQQVQVQMQGCFQQEEAATWSEAFLNSRLIEIAHTPFNLEEGLLLRLNLFTRSAEDHLLLLIAHHIVTDFWSMAVLVHELGILYQAELANHPTILPPLAVQYRDYVHWQADMLASAEGDRLWTYWQKQLAGELPVLNLPTDRPRPPVQTYRGASQSFKLNTGLTQALKSLSGVHGTTLYMTLLSAFQVLLYRYTGQEDLLVGSPTTGRSRAELAGLVGYFVNPVVLRSNLSGNPTFEEFLLQVRQTVLNAFEHQDYPFALLVERLQPTRDPSRSPLFQTMFVLQKAHLLNEAGLTSFALGEPGARMHWGTLELESFALEQRITQFDLTLTMAEADEELLGSLEYNTDLFEADTIARMATHFQTLLAGMVANPSQCLSDLPILTEAEQHQLLVEWNDTKTDYPQEQLIHELFETQAGRIPDAIAVVFEERQMSYRDLNCRANRLAHHLQSLGVGPEVLVGICVERSLEMVVGVLGILKAGGAYVPLDPTYPKERLAFMLEDAQVPVLLTQERLVKGLPEHRALVVCLDTSWQTIAQESEANPTSGVTADNLIYVIYTSGSTGQPKGVQIEHRGLLNLVFWHQQAFAVSQEDRATQVAGTAFDASVLELWPYLAAGASIYIPDEETCVSPVRLRDWFVSKAITTSFLPTPLAESILSVDWPTELKLRTLLTGGDKLYHYPLPSLPFALVNNYGPTENTVVTTSGTVLPEGRTDMSPPIGRPITNTQIYVLDRFLQPVPIGVPGELYVAGEGLARGYLNRPDLTAEKFIHNPFAESLNFPCKVPSTKWLPQISNRLYKTGDQVRYLPSGEIEYLGRLDHQVKIRGFRIELGEIEAVLAQYPAIQEAVVIAQDDGTDLKRLVACVVPQPDFVLSTSELRSHLKQHLPEYMVPSAFAILDALPLTPNGKIDRNALSALDLAPLTPSPNASDASTPIKEMLMGIWATVLRLDHVGIQDNFFELGGHSLLATQVISQVRQIFQVELPLRRLFEFPTIAEFASVVETAIQTGSGLETPPIQRYPHPEAVPLSFAQQRLWFLDQLMPETSAYTIPAAVRLQGRLDTAAIKQSLNQIVQRHEVLRTTFVTVDQQPVQWIHAAQTGSALTLTMPLLDLRHIPERDREAQIWQLAAEAAQAPFDLTGGPLLRAKLLQLADEEHVLLLTMHHIVSDGWSFGVLVKELTLFYDAFSNQKSELLPELPIQYADFALWQRQWLQGDVLETQLSYWKKQLGGSLPVLELPTDHPRPTLPTFQGARRSLQISEPLSKALKRLSQQRGVTLFMTLLAAFNVLLQRYCAQDEIVIGSPIANRNRAEIEPLIGLFANTLVLRTDLSGDPTFEELLERVRQIALSAYAHQDLPFEKLVEELRPERDLRHTPLFQVLFVLQNTPMPVLQLPGLTLSPLEVETKTAKFDLSLSLQETEAGLLGWLEYNSDLFNAATIDRMAGHWHTLLEGIVANPQQRLSQFPLLSQRERQQMLVEWNATDRNFSDASCVHDLFEQQVEQSPDAIAVVFEQQQLTYQQLNRQANQLAHHLRRLGVGPDILVGICVERSIEMVIGVLGILKAGGGYVPLDPTYPVDRLAFMLADAQIKVLLTEQSQLQRLPAPQAEVVCLETDGLAIAQESEENLRSSGVSTKNLAYAIYTSGSTGKPKGVLVSHSAICNHLLWRQTTYPLTATDRFLQKASLGFDISVWEIFSPLLAGAQLILARPGGQQDIPYLVNLIAANHITTFHVIPSLLQLFLEHPGLAACRNLKRVFCGGERLPLQLQERFFERLEANCLEATLHFQYGPTEATVDVTCWDCQRQINQMTVPIGRPITNTQIYLLDRHLQPVPIGVPGELYIGGASLSQGYLNRPDLTAEKFIPHPFSVQPGSRLYKSGDLARYLPDGNLEYLGRIDQQIKLRGFRIELGEIETVLAQHPAIQESAVLAHEETPGDIRLVAYVGVAKPRITEQPSSVAHELHELKGELRSYLRGKLPHYMIPSAFVLLEALPLTPNGKVDRQALPEPKRLHSLLPIAGRTPRTEIERSIATVWQEVLDVEKVGIHDNFFDLGGHSLLMAQIQSKLERICQKEVKLVDLFQYPTVGSLAEYLSQNQGDLNQNQDKQGENPTYQKTYERAAERKKSRERRQKRRQQ